MERRTRGDPAQTKQRILAAAQEVIAQYGVRGLTIRDVAKLAKVSGSVVLHHYESREGLVDACVDVAYDEFKARAMDFLGSIRGEETLVQQVERGVREGFRFARERRQTLGALHAIVAQHGGLDLGRQRAVHLPLLDMMEAWLGPHLGEPRAEVRLRVQSVVMLAARYAFSRDVELVRCTGCADIAAAESAIEHHLAGLGRSLLVGVRERTSTTAVPK